jgi:hypothetical protein
LFVGLVILFVTFRVSSKQLTVLWKTQMPLGCSDEAQSPISKLTTPKPSRLLQLVVLCLYAFLYGKFYLVMSGIQFSLEQQAKITSNASLLSAINTVSLVQIGLLMGLPMVMEMGLEQGFRQVNLAS